MRTLTALLAGHALAGLLAGCTSPVPPNANTADSAPADDGLGAPPDPSIALVAGRYELWEDTEGGESCDVALEQARTIGGHVLVADEACLAKLDLDGEPLAWFVAADGALVFIDATRQRVLTLERHHDGSFYVPRAGRYSLNLTPPNPLDPGRASQ